ncbi:MAG: hypothetical protein JWQ33_2239 [Ramlibacter sp.]|nr:hypothetical protein [Ramlibacter sp.]
MRFLASGGFNTAVTYLLYLVLLHWLSYRRSYTVAFASGIGLAYVLNRYFVFKRPGGSLGPLYVAMIYAGQYVLGLLIVSAWVGWIGGPAKVAPLIAVAISLPLTYLFNAIVFGESSQTNNGDAGLAGMSSARLMRRLAVAVLIGLPLLSLFLNAVGWLRSGFDLPFYDDWRSYATGQIDSLDPGYLFIGLNDTMAPIGLALDAIAQRALDGNSVAYQLLSMTTVLGLLLWLQWSLLKAALGDRIQAAGCFVFTLLMLQPGSYWGRENLAYHQALPLLFLLAAVWLIAVSAWKSQWRTVAVFALGLLAGMSYISGAFGALSAGSGILVVALVAVPAKQRTRLVQGAAALAVAGAITAVAQFKVAVLPNISPEHRGNSRLALPYEPDFWLFYWGKLGRSLLLPESHPVLSLALVVIACGVVVGLAVLLLRRLRSDPGAPLLRVTVIYSAMVATVFVYLLLVAAGRTYLRDSEVKSAIDVFVSGFSRFHFFWAALLWPWVIAAALVVARGRRVSLPPTTAVAASVLCTTGIFLMLAGGALDHLERHRMEASFRNETVSCLMAQLQKGEGIDCAEFNMWDLTPAYIYGSKIGASFVRHFPVLPVDVGVDDPAPWFRLSRDAGHAETRNMSTRPGGYTAGADAQLHIRTGRAEEMANCVMLDVTGIVAAEQDDMVQVYFRPFGQAEFSEANSRSQRLLGHAAPRAFAFRLESETGFEDVLRFDPVNKPQGFAMPDVEVRCRLRYSTRPFFTLTQPPPLPPHPPQLLGSAWLEPVEGDPHAYRAGSDAQVIFKTDKPLQMAECSVLHVQARLAVQHKGLAQVYFMPRGKNEFTEAASSVLAVDPAPDGKAQPLRFRLESPVGFEDKLRFDPINSAQHIRISDVKVSCERHLAGSVTKGIPAPAAEKSTRS